MSDAELINPDDGLDEYDDNYLLCRDPGVRHPWDVLGWWKDGSGGWRRRVRCVRCGAVRDDVEDGWRVRHSYQYPDGYKLGGKVDNAMLREEERRRFKVYPSLEEMEAALKPKRRRR